MVALELDKSQFSVFILLVALLGFVLGCSVGAGSHDWGLGAEIGGSFFAFATVLQGMMVLMYF